MAITDKLSKVTDSTTGRPVVPTLASPGHSIAGTSIDISDATNWTEDTPIHFTIYETTTVGGATVKDTTTQTDWKGTLSGTTISNMTIKGGTDRAYSAGAIVELAPTAGYARDLYDAVSTHTDVDGTLKDNVVTTDVIQDGAVTAVKLASDATGGWDSLDDTPDTVTNNGNRSYDLVFNGEDHTDVLSKGMRIRTTRTVAAPDQCADLDEASSQYFSKISPTGITFTDDFTCSAWVKLESYTGTQAIVNRRSSTDGWNLKVVTGGTVQLQALNSSSADSVTTYQSVPLNKWVHIAATLDMSDNSGKVYLDGVEVPTDYANSISSITQTGDIQIGKDHSTNYLDGKIAQVGVFDAVLSEATIRDIMTHGLSGSETDCVGAWSLDNDLTDLNSNGNDLVANGGATTTDDDSPFGNYGASATLDYGVVTAVDFSTNTTVTVQVPEGCTIDSNDGDIDAVSYSTNSVPYGFPRDKGRWLVETIAYLSEGSSVAVSTDVKLYVPIGGWNLSFSALTNHDSTTSTLEQGTGIWLAASGTTVYDDRLYSRHSGQNQGSLTHFWRTVQRANADISLDSATTMSLAFAPVGSTGANIIASSGIPQIITAECNYL